MSSQKKSATLGMPHGTANNRLRKIILFHLLKKHNENICVRCDQIIENIDDLSIEHIRPWEGISADLFWDLNNIAFSHIRCNVPHRYNDNVNRRIQAPEGQSRCSTCEEFKSLSEFATHSARWNGVDTECKSCKNERNALRDRRKFATLV